MVEADQMLTTKIILVSTALFAAIAWTVYRSTECQEIRIAHSFIAQKCTQ